MVFTHIDVIGEKIYSYHPKNMNHVHKKTKDFVSVIITLGNNIIGGDTLFYDRVKTTEFINRDHVLKHLHSRIIFGLFEIFFMKVFYGGYTEQ